MLDYPPDEAEPAYPETVRDVADCFTPSVVDMLEWAAPETIRRRSVSRELAPEADTERRAAWGDR